MHQGEGTEVHCTAIYMKEKKRTQAFSYRVYSKGELKLGLVPRCLPQLLSSHLRGYPLPADPLLFSPSVSFLNCKHGSTTLAQPLSCFHSLYGSQRLGDKPSHVNIIDLLNCLTFSPSQLLLLSSVHGPLSHFSRVFHFRLTSGPWQCPNTPPCTFVILTAKSFRLQLRRSFF